jgi:Ni/Fe-hydrogenase subunit HybB-like protein
VSDRDGATGSADRDRDKENPAVPIMLYTAIVVGAMLTALLAGGIGMAGATSYKVGPYVGYALGLTMITIASVMGVGAGALLSQRAILKDHANIHAEVRELRGEVAAAHSEVLSELQALLTIERYNSETLADQLTARRNGHTR